MLALCTMADAELKGDLNNATYFCNRNSVTFCICVGLYDRNIKYYILYYIQGLAVETAFNTFSCMV